MSNLIERLREYANNNGYSHGDYADTMSQAADSITTLKEQNAELQGQLSYALAGEKEAMRCTDHFKEQNAQLQQSLADALLQVEEWKRSYRLPCSLCGSS